MKILNITKESGIRVNHKYLETGRSIFLKRPNDFQELKKEVEYKNYLTHIRGTRKQLFYVTRDYVKETTAALRDQINEEITRLEGD